MTKIISVDIGVHVRDNALDTPPRRKETVSDFVRPWETDLRTDMEVAYSDQFGDPPRASGNVRGVRERAT
jgi:hypothetical protein